MNKRYEENVGGENEKPTNALSGKSNNDSRYSF